MKIYAAYGSNINLEQMLRRCPRVVPIGKGWLMNYHLLFRGYGSVGVATVEPRKGRRVPILLWAITGESEVALDHYEGFPTLYLKETVKVEGMEWQPNQTIPHDTVPNVSAMIYVMNHGHLALPSQTYLDCIKNGYRILGFHQRYLSEAVRFVKRNP